MRTEKTPGVLEFLVVSSLSPSQFWMVKTTAALFQHHHQLHCSQIVFLMFVSNVASRRRDACRDSQPPARSGERCDLAKLGNALPSDPAVAWSRHIPSDVSVACKHGSHGQRGGNCRRKVGLVARGGGLLIGDDYCGIRHVSNGLFVCARPTGVPIGGFGRGIQARGVGKG